MVAAAAAVQMVFHQCHQFPHLDPCTAQHAPFDQTLQKAAVVVTPSTTSPSGIAFDANARFVLSAARLAKDVATAVPCNFTILTTVIW
jgi:hypothetical protein